MKDYIMLIGVRRFIIDSGTLEIKSEVSDWEFGENNLKVPKVVDENLMLYLSSDTCLKVFYNGYSYTFEVDTSSVLASYYINSEYCFDIVNTMISDLYACKVAGAVMVHFYGRAVLLFDGKAYLLSYNYCKESILKEAHGLSKSEYSILLMPYYIEFTADGIKTDSKQFRRKLLLESI